MCSAMDTKCERAALIVSKLEKGPADFDYDTGWVPSNSPIQIRLIVALHDRTQVDLGGYMDATWPDPIMLSPKGTPTQGHISIDDGFEVSAQARFMVSVGGQTYSWTGNIPYVPNVNFIASATKQFDPWAWKGSDPSLTTVTAQTATQKIMQVPLTNAIINIPGISGGFELDGSADFSAWYDTLSINFDDADHVVDPTHADTRLLISPTPSFDTNVFIHGEVTRQITLHFVPAFYFQILGKDFTLPLADLPLALPASNPEAWDFDPVAVHVPLPEISIPKTTIDVGDIPVDVGTDAYVSITNIGEEVLDGTVDTLAPMAEIDTPIFQVTPQQSAGLKLLLVPHAPGPFDVMLHLGSNDPLAPDSYVHITGTAGKPTIGEPAGCGCSTPGMATRDPSVLFGLLALVRIARRRSASRSPA
jgi:MYXO-CTERM domain-containing protein